MSHLAWIDFDRDAQKAAREMMAQMTAPEARDELGLGTVRGGLADLLFPGTSTIQTRVHYMLFVPWIWGMAARGSTAAARIDRARKLEFRLSAALLKNGKADGVIGRVAGKELKRLPSDIYWAGLGIWGIRYGTVSPERTLHAGMRDGLWHDDLPTPPPGFPDTATFTLREEDAGFLHDRIVANRTALADLALRGKGVDIGETPYAWEIDEAVFSPQSLHLLTLAEGFAWGMQGASLLYNLMAAERAAMRPNAAKHGAAEALVEKYSGHLEDWATKVDFDAWQPDAIYDAVRRTGRNPSPQLQAFAVKWIALARSDPHTIVENDAARTLIVARERALKRGRTARLSDDSALDRWGGASGAGILGYRWNTARRFLRDLSGDE